MPYKSIQQMRFMHAQHPDIAAKWDAEIDEQKKKGKYRKPPRRVKKNKEGFLKPVLAGAAAGVLANQVPTIESGIKRHKRRAEKKYSNVKEALQKSAGPSSYEEVVHSDDPTFNHDAARKIYDIVMKMDDDSADMFVYMVASNIFEEDVDRNLRTYQRHLNDVLATRRDRVMKALARLALDGDDRALAYAEEISKDDKKVHHNPYYYGYKFQESDFNRDPATGRFAAKVHHTMDKPLHGANAKAIIGSSGEEKDIKDILNSAKDKDKAKANYQDEYRQVAGFLEMARQAHGSGNSDVLYHLHDTAGHSFVHVDNSGSPNKAVLADPETRLHALEAKPTTLTTGGAAYGLMGAFGREMTPEQMARATKADQAVPDFTQGWVEAGDNQISNMATYQRLASTGKLAATLGAPGGKVQLAGKLAEVVGSYGPQAEQVIGPTARKTAYRYRGVETTPDKTLARVYGQEIFDAKKYGAPRLTPELRAKIDEELTTTRGGTKGGGEAGIRTKQIHAAIKPETPPSLTQMAASRAGDAQLMIRNPTWDERRAGDAVIQQYLKLKIPQKGLYGLHIAAGNTPPSEGVIVDANGSLAVQAVGYGDDHYLPFNLKNLKALKGGEYIRNRSVGGLTSEDVYTGLMAGARRVTVVSRSGTFTMEFAPDFRGGRRYNDKALRMTRRYEQILDAVQSGQVERKEIPLKWRKQIEKEVADDMPGATKAQLRDEIKERIKEFKEDPEIDLRDRDRAEALIQDMDDRAARGEVRNYDAKQYRAQIMNELRDMKEVRFRLNGLGYEAALKSLQEQFPYYIEDVRTTTHRDEELKEFEQDKGYVEPGRNRPTAARAGLFGTEENKGEKYSASWADYQRGRGKAKGQWQRSPGGKLAARAPEPTTETETATATGGGIEGRQNERDKKAQGLADQFATLGKERKMRGATVDLWKVITQNYPRSNWDGEPPDWYDLKDEKEFRDYIGDPDKMKRFMNDVVANRKNWDVPGGGGVPGARDALFAYDRARGGINQVKYTKTLGRIFPTDSPYSFPDEDGAAYHANAKASDITHELTQLDKEPLFTTSNKLSTLSDAELEAELDATNDLWSLAQNKNYTKEEILQRWSNSQQGAASANTPSTTRMKPLLENEDRIDEHLKKLHQTRFLKEQQANVPAARTGGIPGQGGSTNQPSGGGNGGGNGGQSQRAQPGAPQTEYDKLSKAGKVQADNSREIYLDMLKKANQDLLSAMSDVQHSKRANELYPQIHAAFLEMQKPKKTHDQVMNIINTLSEDQKQYIHETSGLEREET